MNILKKIGGLFRAPVGGKGAPLDERSFREILQVGGSDWATGGLSIDQEVFQNVFSLKAAMRDLWRSNSALAKYVEQLLANVYGDSGIMLRMKIKETEDRVVYSPDMPEEAKGRAMQELYALRAHEARIQRIMDWAGKKTGKDPAQYRAYKLAEELDRRSMDSITRGRAMIEVGAPDIYASSRVEEGWTTWQRAENCDIRGRRDYCALRHVRLLGAARDGGHFIRQIRDSSVNQFGYALQHINDEWVDYFYNEAETSSGTTIRMGIEYPFTAWGIGKPVAYHFISRVPRDWQTGGRYGGGPSFHARTRVPASEVIHYARLQDTDATRPPPWGVSALGKVRQLDQAEVAWVVASRMEACKLGFLYSDMPDATGAFFNGEAPNPAKAGNIKLAPGGLYALPWGVKAEMTDPSHTNGNFEEFRKGMLRSIAAAFPGADYNGMASDLEGINFSAGRLGRLDKNEICRMLLTTFDIPMAERPVFEGWLEMALISGALPFKYNKIRYKKFNQPSFTGPGFDQVDEVKAITAAALRIENKLSCYSAEAAQIGVDFDDNLIRLAEEKMAMEQFGMSSATTAASAPASTPQDSEDDSEEVDPEEEDDAPPAKPKTNGKAHPKLTKAKRLVLNP